MGAASNDITTVRRVKRTWEKRARTQIGWGPSLCKVFLWPRSYFLCLSLMLCCLTACYLGCWTASWQPAHSDQQPPSKKQWRGEFNCRTVRPLGVCGENWATGLYFSLSLPLHVSLSLFHFLSLEPVRATELRLERGVGNKWRTLPDTLLFISQLSVFSHLKLCGLHINLGKCSRFSILMN